MLAPFLSTEAELIVVRDIHRMSGIQTNIANQMKILRSGLFEVTQGKQMDHRLRGWQSLSSKPHVKCD